MPNYEEEVTRVEYQLSREEYIKTKMEEIKHRYFNIYNLDATKEMRLVEENYIETFKQEFDKVWQMERKQLHREQLSEYQHGLHTEPRPHCKSMLITSPICENQENYRVKYKSTSRIFRVLHYAD